VLAGSPALVVRNPVAAVGGTDPEPMEQVRTDAPHAFRVLRRAVTASDYGTVLTEGLPGVQRAAGRLRWTGSWHTAFVTVDRVGGAPVDAPYRREVASFLEDFRMAGVDVDVSAPVPVPVELALAVCASPDRFTRDVESEILAVLSSGVLADGRRGLFHPDNFTFGVPVYLSRVYAAVLGVPGVRTVGATVFRRYAGPDAGELSHGVLRVKGLEIVQLANDPDVPERGLLTVTVEGAR
jgi:predicted phage baseplate assembly protein